MFDKSNFNFNDYEIKNILKRTKNIKLNFLELSLIEAMWSEHCSYKHSKNYLSNFYKKGCFFEGENASGIKIGNKVIIFKMESHNHPSAIEPFEGASTGVGGIVRDILAMNAKPVALFNSLKFSNIIDNKTKYLFSRIISGISVYSNCIGIPNIGGEVEFLNCYKDNPLVNVMALGIGDFDNIKLSKPSSSGLKLILLGSKTGKDGVNGAKFASNNLLDSAKDIEYKLQSKLCVQICDPFMKKKLIGLMLEVLKIDGVIASQDCGACGILSSVSEMAHKGNCGVILNLDLVNLRQKDMTPYDILLSESQERMVIAVEDWCVDEVMALTKKHGVFASVFGETTYNNDFKVLFNNEIVANIPVNILNEPVYYKLKNIKPSYIRYVEKQKINIKLKQKTKNLDGILNENIKSIVSNVNFCSKKYVYEQYDYLVGNSTVKWPQNCGGASIIKLDENIFCGISITSNPKKVYMSPKNGTILAIMDGYRKLIASGLKPIGITDCLNFANIENSMIAYQFIQCIKGIEYISNKLKIPVVSGNVSFYNETNNSKIYPTPIFGTVGVIDKYKKIIKNHFSLDEEIFLIGNTVNFKTNTCGSLFLDIFYNFNGGKIGKVNLENDIEMCKLIFKLNEVGILKSCINVSTGGIFGAIFRGLSNNKLGFSGNLVFNNDTNIFNIQNELFGEISNVRYLVGVKDVLKLENILKKDNLPYKYLGKVVDRDFTFNGFNFDNKVFYDVFNDTLEKTMD